MKSRHRSREIAFQILYELDLLVSGAKSKLPQKEAEFSASDIQQHIRAHFHHFKVPEELQAFASELALGTLKNLSEIDALIQKKAEHWKLGRMSLVDRNLLRMATFELRFLKESATAIVLNEAIELAKVYGSSETSAFINGILDGLSDLPSA